MQTEFLEDFFAGILKVNTLFPPIAWQIEQPLDIFWVT